MCVTNFYTDRYPDGQENHFRQLSLCPYSCNGQPCANHEILNNYPRDIQYGEPTSAQMFPQTQVPQTPPTSSSSSRRPSSNYAVLDSDDGAASGTGTYSSGGTRRKRHQSAKSKAMLALLGVRIESPADRRKRKEREAKRDRIVLVDETVHVDNSGPSPPRPSYTRPVPGPVSPEIPGNIRYSQPLGVPYTPGPTRQPPTIFTQMPDTPPVIHDAFPSPQPAVTRDAFPQPSMTGDAFSPHLRSVSPVRIPERNRRPHGPAQPPVIIQNPPPRSRDPSPPPVVVRAPTPAPQPPAPPAAVPVPERARSQSRVRVAPTTPSPDRRREGSRDSERRRGRSPEASYRRTGRRDESIMRRQRFFAKDEEIRNRPAVPMAPRDAGTPREVQIERERRPYIAPVVEQSRRLNDMMGGLNIRSAAPPVVSRPVVDSGMMGRLSERQAPLSRQNSISAAQAGAERRTAGAAERRRERHRILYDDGTVRWE